MLPPLTMMATFLPSISCLHFIAPASAAGPRRPSARVWGLLYQHGDGLKYLHVADQEEVVQQVPKDGLSQFRTP